jgi:hypothetical protein
MELSDVFRVAFRLNRLFFPADLFDFAKSISKRKYAMLGPIGPRRPLPLGQLGGNMDPMVQKDGSLLDVNTEKGVVGVTGPNVDSTLDAMNEITKIFQDVSTI